MFDTKREKITLALAKLCGQLVYLTFRILHFAFCALYALCCVWLSMNLFLCLSLARSLARALKVESRGKERKKSVHVQCMFVCDDLVCVTRS